MFLLESRFDSAGCGITAVPSARPDTMQFRGEVYAIG
jgi:hypothetical protein